ncbi:hypothetical protein GGS24DRAFT_512193 [Hypoxylon argillaceum]|nr:hypothetical protein GGS24DRAFT_512193 [Hypoxylon argillaceum]
MTSTSINLSETHHPNLYASSTIPYVIALACVILRFWCRWVNGAGFWLDDWLVLIALIFATDLLADLLYGLGIPRGLGKHVQTFGPHLAYTSVIVFVNINLPITILGSIVGAWGIAVLLLTLLQCVPTRDFGDKTIEAACNVDSQKFLFGISIPTSSSMNQKQVLVSILLLGGFVCIASILRLVALVTESTGPDISWNIINQSIWAVVEADFAIISACLPTLRPFWLAIRPKQFLTGRPTASLSIPNSKTSYQKIIPRTWGASLLRSTVLDEQDAQPFSGAHQAVEDDLRNALVPDNQQATATVLVPLS